MQRFPPAVTSPLAPVVLAAALLAGNPALAGWSHDPGMPPAGLVTGEGSNGVLVLADCDDSGRIGIGIAGYDPGSRDVTFLLRVDSESPIAVHASCGGDSCLLGLADDDLAHSVLAALRSGKVLKIGLGRSGIISDVPLAGAGRALDALKARGCTLP